MKKFGFLALLFAGIALAAPASRAQTMLPSVDSSTVIDQCHVPGTSQFQSCTAGQILSNAMSPSAGNAQLPGAQDNLGASQVPQRNPAIVCNDLTYDNQPAIQAAVDALEANSTTGGVINLPACNFINNTSEIHISKSGIFLLGAGSTGLPALHTTSSWAGISTSPAPTVLAYTGTGGIMVRFEPDAGGTAVLGGGMRNIVLAGRGVAEQNLVLKTVRGAIFDHVVAENCTATCVELNVTTNVLASASEFCDTQHNLFYGLKVFINPALTASASATGIVLDGLTDTSTPANGCAAHGEIEVNTSYNEFYHTEVSTINGVAVDVFEAGDNHFWGGLFLTSNAHSLDLNCAQSNGRYSARRNRFEDIIATGAIASYSCGTSFRAPGQDSAQQNWIKVSLSTGGQKPVFAGGVYSPDASMFWQASDGTGNYSARPDDYRSQRYYMPSNDIGAVSNGTAPGANTIKCRLEVIDASKPTELDQGGARVATTDAAGHFQAAIYMADGTSGAPGTFITSTGDITAATGGSQLGDWTQVRDFGPKVGGGSYVGRHFWACFNTDSATVAFSSVGLTTATAVRDGVSTVSNLLSAAKQGVSCAGSNCQGGSSTYNTWPASLATSTWTVETSNTIPVLNFRVK